MASHHVRVIDAAEDLDLAAHLAAHGVLVVTVDDFEGVEAAGGTVNHFVDSTPGAGADSVEAIEVGEADGGRGRVLTRRRRRVRV